MKTINLTSNNIKKLLDSGIDLLEIINNLQQQAIIEYLFKGEVFLKVDKEENA